MINYLKLLSLFSKETAETNQAGASLVLNDDVNLVDEELIHSLMSDNICKNNSHINNISGCSNHSNQANNEDKSNNNNLEEISNIYELFDIDGNNAADNANSKLFTTAADDDHGMKHVHNNPEFLFDCKHLRTSISNVSLKNNNNNYNNGTDSYYTRKKRLAIDSSVNSNQTSPSVSPSLSPASLISSSAPSSFLPLSKINYGCLKPAPIPPQPYSNENTQDSMYSLTLPTQSFMEKNLKTKTRKKRINSNSSSKSGAGSSAVAGKRGGKKSPPSTTKRGGKDLDNLDEEHNENDFDNDEDSAISPTSLLHVKP